MRTRCGAAKFAGNHFVEGPGGLPLARNAVAVFVCRMEQRYPGGDHTILIGAVQDVSLGEVPTAMVHFRRGFYAVDPTNEAFKFGVNYFIYGLTH